MDTSAQVPVFLLLAGVAIFPALIAWELLLNRRRPMVIRLLGLLPTVGGILGWIGMLCFTFPVFSGGKTVKGDEWLQLNTVYVKGYTRETTSGLWRFQRWSDEHLPSVMILAAAISVLGALAIKVASWFVVRKSDNHDSR